MPILLEASTKNVSNCSELKDSFCSPLKPKGLYTCTVFTVYTEPKISRGAKMPNITLSIPEDLKKQINSLPELNVSEAVREFLSEKVKRALLLKKLDKMLEKSELTEEDCLRLGNKIKEGMWKRYKEQGW